MLITMALSSAEMGTWTPLFFSLTDCISPRRGRRLFWTTSISHPKPMWAWAGGYATEGPQGPPAPHATMYLSSMASMVLIIGPRLPDLLTVTVVTPPEMPGELALTITHTKTTSDERITNSLHDVTAPQTWGKTPTGAAHTVRKSVVYPGHLWIRTHITFHILNFPGSLLMSLGCASLAADTVMNEVIPTDSVTMVTM